MQPQTPSPTMRRLRRSDDRKIAGVCSGIADYFRVDPTLVRVLFVGGLLLGAGSLLVYAAAWLLMPGPEPVMLPPAASGEGAAQASWPAPAQAPAFPAPAPGVVGDVAPGPWAANHGAPAVGLPPTGTDGPQG